MPGKRDFTEEAAQTLKTKYREWGIKAPSLHVVLGSGYGKALETLLSEAQAGWAWEKRGELPFAEVPGLITASAPDHRGAYRYFSHKKTQQVLALQMGRLHGYEGIEPEQVVRTVVAPCLAGTQAFVLTNASGALHRKYPVGSAILITDHVNFTGKNPLVGPKFIDMSQAYDPSLRAKLRPHLQKAGGRSQ
jgi:purine-nucleoside phosphorylase